MGTGWWWGGGAEVSVRSIERERGARRARKKTGFFFPSFSFLYLINPFLVGVVDLSIS